MSYVKWAPSGQLPPHSLPYLIALAGVSLGCFLWWRRASQSFLPWRRAVTAAIGLAVILNPISWAARSGIVGALGKTEGGSPYLFALGLAYHSHGICLALQGLGRPLIFGSQLALQAALAAAAAWHVPGIGVDQQLADAAVQQLLQGVYTRLSYLSLVLPPQLAPPPLWQAASPPPAQCRAVVFFAQVSSCNAVQLFLQDSGCISKSALHIAAQ